MRRWGLSPSASGSCGRPCARAGGLRRCTNRQGGCAPAAAAEFSPGARGTPTARPTGANAARRSDNARVGPTELLANVPLFSELSAEELERVARVAVPRSYPKGVRVFHEGDTSDACYVVREGDLRVTREHPDGRAISLATLGPRDIFGELAMLDGGTRSASIETLSDCELLALPANDMRRVIADHGEIAAKLIAALTRRLRETNERVARQSFQTVPSRVAGVLLQLTAEETVPDGRDGVTLKMNQIDLAQLAGTSRESVSRFLATLERAGVVRVGRGRVTVIEPERLDAYIF